MHESEGKDKEVGVQIESANMISKESFVKVVKKSALDKVRSSPVDVNE